MNMKTLVLLLIVLASSISLFSQSKVIKSGLYLVLPKDSCSAQNNKNTVIISSDTLCLGQNAVIGVKDIDSCITRSSRLDGKEMYVLNIKLKDAARLKFKNITEKNVGRGIAMVIRGDVVMSAVIRDPVTSGRLTVSGAKPGKIKEWGKELRKEIEKK